MSVRSLRYNTLEGRNWKGSTLATDRDALAFLEAAQVYNRNQQKAIVDLVRSLKRTGLWSKMKAIYPFVGGTASSHKWNLKDPRDVDAAYRLQFNGGWTHSANGVLPNGSTAYANTYLNPASSLTIFNAHLSYYARSGSLQPTNIDIGNFGGQGNQLFCLITPRASGTAIAIHTNQSSSSYFAQKTGYTTAVGYWLSTRTSNANADFSLWRNSTKEGTPTLTDTKDTFFSNSIYIGALNSGGNADYYTNKECAFATIGDGLTDTDATNLYDIVDLYQKRLGRAV